MTSYLPLISATSLLMLAACQNDVVVFTDEDNKAIETLRGDWLAESRAEPGCYKRWILVSSLHGDFEEGCVSTQDHEGAAVRPGLWLLSGTRLEVTYSPGGATPPPIAVFSVERIANDEFVLRESNGSEFWTFRRSTF